MLFIILSSIDVQNQSLFRNAVLQSKQLLFLMLYWTVHTFVHDASLFLFGCLEWSHWTISAADVIFTQSIRKCAVIALCKVWRPLGFCLYIVIYHNFSFCWLLWQFNYIRAIQDLKWILCNWSIKNWQTQIQYFILYWTFDAISLYCNYHYLLHWNS